MVQLQSEILEGPLEHPLLGRCVVVRPTVETTRANRHPSQAVVVTTAARRLIELSKAGEKLAAVLVEGEKDPTTHPEFHEISHNLRELMNKWYPKAKLTLFAKQAELSKPDTRHALSFYDVPIVNLPGGTQKVAGKLWGGTIQEHKALVEDLPEGEREQARFAFELDPRDTATPRGMATLLEKVWRGEALGRASTGLLIDIMERCETGDARLKGLLPEDTVVAHKTGTIGRTTNDVGVVTLPGHAGHVVPYGRATASPGRRQDERFRIEACGPITFVAGQR